MDDVSVRIYARARAWVGGWVGELIHTLFAATCFDSNELARADNLITRDDAVPWSVCRHVRV